MNNQLKLPDTPLIRLSYRSLVVVGILLYSFITPWHDIPPAPPKPPIIITDTSFEQARQIEMAWINNTFDLELDYLLAPVSPLPCPANIQGIPNDISTRTQQAINIAKTGKFTQSIGILNPMVRGDSAHWLPVLTLAVLYVQHNQERMALPILERYLRADASSTKQSDDTKIGMIHLLYMNGLLRLKTGQYHSDYLLWGGLKSPIRISKQLGLNPTSNVPIQTPGCPYNENDLTTYKLYNNLIVGYLKTKNFIASRRQRNKECSRSYSSNPPPLNENPLFPVLEVLCPDRDIEEYWVWAISNAESLLTMAPTPPDSLLSFNLMLLIDSLLKEHGAQLANEKKALSQKQEEMRHLSLSEWKSAPEEYKKILVPSLGKLATTLAVNQGDQIPPNLESYQTDEQAAEVIKAIRLTVSIRNGAPIQWLTTRRGEIKQMLGKRADEWLKAMDKNIPNHNQPPDEGLLKTVKLVGIWISYNKMKLAIILLSAILVWLLGKWMEIQVREIKALFSSFYGEEWEMINAATRQARRR